MRIVLDTNVFISGLFFSGPPHQILKAWRRGKIKLVISPEIFEEYRRVGETLAKHYSGIDISAILEMVTLQAEVVMDLKLPEGVCKDPGDDKFLAAAIASRSRFVVSGDKHLVNVSSYKGIEIVRPRKFVDNYLKNK